LAFPGAFLHFLDVAHLLAILPHRRTPSSAKLVTDDVFLPARLRMFPMFVKKQRHAWFATLAATSPSDPTRHRLRLAEPTVRNRTQIQICYILQKTPCAFLSANPQPLARMFFIKTPCMFVNKSGVPPPAENVFLVLPQLNKTGLSISK
jgi:hypothetical protein